MTWINADNLATLGTNALVRRSGERSRLKLAFSFSIPLNLNRIERQNDR
jgi:hypothetical protein